jgi:hypothetical protein
MVDSASKPARARILLFDFREITLQTEREIVARAKNREKTISAHLRRGALRPKSRRKGLSSRVKSTFRARHLGPKNCPNSV